MTIINRNLKAFSVFIIASIMSVSVMAYEGHHKGFYKELNLTAEQKAQIKALKEGQRENRKQTKEQYKAMKANKAALMKNYTEEQAMILADEIAKIHKEKALKRLAHQYSIYSILDDEQKEKYESMLEKRNKGKHPKKMKHYDCDE